MDALIGFENEDGKIHGRFFNFDNIVDVEMKHDAGVAKKYDKPHMKVRVYDIDGNKASYYLEPDEILKFLADIYDSGHMTKRVFARGLKLLRAFVAKAQDKRTGEMEDNLVDISEILENEPYPEEVLQDIDELMKLPSLDEV